jgi:hypothetical protein
VLFLPPGLLLAFALAVWAFYLAGLFATPAAPSIAFRAVNEAVAFAGWTGHDALSF